MTRAEDELESICKRLVDVKLDAQRRGVKLTYYMPLVIAQRLIHDLHVRLERTR